MADLRKRLIVRPGKHYDLSAVDAASTCGFDTREEAEESLKADSKAISDFQEKLHAEGERALLVILQGMDTSGKDGTIKAVFGRTTPLGLFVVSFTRPTPEELAHDFLWRVHKVCPKRGTIGVFNRSHYEDVLAGRVRKTVASEVIAHRHDQINAFEDMISSSTRVLKIMLHISKDKQRERLQERLDDPDKHWKFDPGDLADRALWTDYMAAYSDVLVRCSTVIAPWYVVPSDRKWVRNAVVASLVRQELEDLDPRYPAVTWDPASFRVEP